MPRLPPTLLLKASIQSPHLPKLLRECRDLQSARNELRWLTEYLIHSHQIQQQRDQQRDQRDHQRRTNNNADLGHEKDITTPTPKIANQLRDLVNRRSKGEPLQYILGTQPFGDLEILCRKGVLIPRPETEVYTTRVAECLRQAWREGAFGFGDGVGVGVGIDKQQSSLSSSSKLKIADFCSGSGCISLLLHSLLCPVDDADAGKDDLDQSLPVEIQGFDISPLTLNLSKDNLRHNIHCGTLCQSADRQVVFQYLDVLALDRKMRSSTTSAHLQSDDKTDTALAAPLQSWDVIISNPPYISPSDYAPGGTTSRSVRMYEPKLALVPPDVVDGGIEQADQFYHAIMRVGQNADSKMIVMEIGDSNQARRVRDLAVKVFGKDDDFLLETWRDDGIVDGYPRTLDDELHNNPHSEDTSAAHERAIVVWRHSLGRWRKSKFK